MKQLLVLLLVAVAAWFLWTRFRPPTLDGPEIAEQDRVTYVTERDHVSVADRLYKNTWTVLLFTSRSSPESDRVARRMEVALRERVRTVRLVVIDVGDLDSSAARGLGLKVLPAARLYDAYRLKTDDLETILSLLGA